MKVREVLMLAAAFLNDSQLRGELGASGGTGEAATLVQCFNVVENEIALDYYPLKKREHMTFSEGKLELSAFSTPPVDILSVRDGGGGRIPFTLFPSRIEADCREADILYSYAPTPKEIGEDSELGGKISARLMALGVASEYCLLLGRQEEARLFGIRYRDALRAAGILRHPLSVRSRRWA